MSSKDLYKKVNEKENYFKKQKNIVEYILIFIEFNNYKIQVFLESNYRKLFKHVEDMKFVIN